MEGLVSKATKVWGILARASSVMLFAAVILIIVNVIVRRFFNAPIYGSTEIICYLVLSVASFALSQNEWIGGNVRMTLLVDALSVRKRDKLILVINIVCFIGTVIVSILIVRQVIARYNNDMVSVSLHIPMWIIVSLLAIGFCALGACFFCKTLLNIYTLKTNNRIDLVRYVKEHSNEDMLE